MEEGYDHDRKGGGDLLVLIKGGKNINCLDSIEVGEDVSVGDVEGGDEVSVFVDRI